MVIPLLKDVVPSIQQTASLAMGRLASQSPSLSNEIIQAGLLPHINNTLASKNVYLKFAYFILNRLILVRLAHLLFVQLQDIMLI